MAMSLYSDPLSIKIYQLINSLDNKMKRQNLFNILLVSLFAVSTFLVSCSNDNPDEKITSGTRLMKFNVSQSFDENPSERVMGSMEKPDTIYQKLNDSTQIKAVIEQDKAINSRAEYPVLAGTRVLAIVADASTDKIYKMHQLTVENDGSLSCEVPNFAVRTIFYSYNSTSKIPISNQNYAAFEKYYNDVMWFKTQQISSTDTSLGTIKFKHLFSRVRVEMHDRTGSGISSFDTKLKECTYEDVLMDIEKGIASSYDILIDLPLNATSTPQTILDSDYKTIIPNEEVSTMKLEVNKINNITLTNQSMSFTKKFELGYSYTIHLYVESNNQVTGNGEVRQDWTEEVTETNSGIDI